MRQTLLPSLPAHANRIKIEPPASFYPSNHPSNINYSWVVQDTKNSNSQEWNQLFVAGVAVSFLHAFHLFLFTNTSDATGSKKLAVLEIGIDGELCGVLGSEIRCRPIGTIEAWVNSFMEYKLLSWSYGKRASVLSRFRFSSQDVWDIPSEQTPNKTGNKISRKQYFRLPWSFIVSRAIRSLPFCTNFGSLLTYTHNHPHNRYRQIFWQRYYS